MITRASCGDLTRERRSSTVLSCGRTSATPTGNPSASTSGAGVPDGPEDGAHEQARLGS
jgi:hypothetical protein